MRVHSIALRASKEESVSRQEPAVELEEVVLEASRPDRKSRLVRDSSRTYEKL